MWVLAVLTSIAPVSVVSRKTSSLLPNISKAREEGILRPCMASPHKYSLIVDLKTALPSANLE